MSAQATKRPRDANKLALAIVRAAAIELEAKAERKDPDAGKDPAAVALGRRGGLKGGRARAEKLSPERRREIARPLPPLAGPTASNPLL